MLDNPEVTSTRPPARPPDPLFRRSIALAATIGLSYAGFVHGVSPGIGWSMFLVGLIGSLYWHLGDTLDRQSRLILLGAALIAALIAVRDLPSLAALNLAAYCSLVTIVIGLRRRPNLQQWNVSALLIESIDNGFGVVFSPAEYLRAGSPATERSPRRLRVSLGPVIGGLGISVFVLAIFGSLMASADAVFESFADSLFGSLEDIPNMLSRLTGSVIAAWFTLGVIARLRGSAPIRPSVARPPSLQPPVVLIPLVSLNLLFATFVTVQFAYLFGGADTVARTGLTHAEYARRGFFELVAVAALVVGIILIAEWVTRSLPERRLILATSQALLALTLVVAVAAVRRMLLYVDEFGLTELRVYTTTFLVWVGFILIWMSVTILRRRANRFVIGTVVSAFLLTVGLNLAHPAALIANANLDRAAEDKELDIHYLIRLGPGAEPTIRTRVDELPSPTERGFIENALESVGSNPDWRWVTVDELMAKAHR